VDYVFEGLGKLMGIEAAGLHKIRAKYLTWPFNFGGVGNGIL